MQWSRAGDAPLSASRKAARAKRIEPPLPHTFDTATSKSFLTCLEAQDAAAFKRYRPRKRHEPPPLPAPKGKPKLDMGTRPSTAQAKMRHSGSVRFDSPSLSPAVRPSTSMGSRGRPGTPGSVSPVWRVASQTPQSRCACPCLGCGPFVLASEKALLEFGLTAFVGPLGWPGTMAYRPSRQTVRPTQNAAP